MMRMEKNLADWPSLFIKETTSNLPPKEVPAGKFSPGEKKITSQTTPKKVCKSLATEESKSQVFLNPHLSLPPSPTQ